MKRKSKALAEKDNLQGRKFHRLLVLEISPKNSATGKRRWNCQCDCGTLITVDAGSLLSGNTKSCGCLQVETVSQRNAQAGKYSREIHETRLFRIWSGMNARTKYKSQKDYHTYGGRGIRVCDEWLDFFVFRDWALLNGYRDCLTIDRIDNDKGYSPSNCRWASRSEQASNKRSSINFTLDGKTMSARHWSKQLQIPYQTILSRRQRGYSVEQILSKHKEVSK